jgi:hypothetical protein
LFAPGKDTLVIYSMMFPRWSQDPRAGAAGGRHRPGAAAPVGTTPVAGTAPSRTTAVTAACRIAMGVTMAFALLIMI